MANKITTLYEDSAKTNAIYPRTKASAVSDDNGNALGNIAVYNAQTLYNSADPIFLQIDSDTVFSITKDDTGATLATPITFKIVAKS